MKSRPRIPPHCFTDEAVLAREQALIFRGSWQFFCLKTDLLAHNDFVAETVAGVPVVVQNIRGELHAFHNLCSHRHSPIQTEAAGNRALYCPYHGWVYGASGEPVGIPHNAAFYPILPEQQLDLSLTRFSVEVCGQFVFVSIAPTASLAEQLGEWRPLLSRIADACDDLYFKSVLPAQCNWKFVVQNAFDDIHAQFVHPSASLDTSVYTDAHWRFHDHVPGSEDLRTDYSKRHAQLDVSMDAATLARNETLWGRPFPMRAHRFDTYLHLFIYPNLIVTSVQGYWYNIVRYKPVSAESSEMTYWLVPARPSQGRADATPELLYRLAMGSLRVFNEDLGAVEVAQRGIRSVTRAGVLGQREDKIASFESAYMDLMQTGAGA